jgi:hypothetical protein
MKKFVLLILMASLLAGCKKDDTSDPLSRYRLKEYTKDHYKLTFEYDSVNRIVKSGTYYDNVLVYSTRYFYVNGKIDSLITYNSYYPITYETYRYIGDTIYHITYRYSFDDKIILKYNVHDNQIEKIIYPPCVMGDSSFPCRYEVLHWDNNNLTYKHIYNSEGWTYPDYKSSENTKDFQQTNNVWSAYDDHANPLKFIYKQIYPEEYESSKNNLLRMVITDMEGDTLIRIFNHTYDEHGLPTVTRETQEKNDTPLNEGITLVSSTYTYEYEEYR